MAAAIDADNMADTSYYGGRIFQPVCGDHPSANAQVELATSFGFEAVDVGRSRSPAPWSRSR